MVWHLCLVRAPGPRAVLQRPGQEGPRQGQAPGPVARVPQKARALLAPCPPASAGWGPAALQGHRCHHVHGCPGQRPPTLEGGVHDGVPGRCSCTPAPRQSYWHCHDNHHTRSGCTGPRRPRSTSGLPSLCTSRGRWAAGTAQGRHSWAGPRSLPPGGLLQRPHCHSNSQTGNPDTPQAHSAGPGASGRCDPWKPLLWILVCSHGCPHCKTSHSLPAGVPEPWTPHQGSSHTCSADTRPWVLGSPATVAQATWCSHQGSTHGGCVCNHGALGQTSGAVVDGVAVCQSLDQALAADAPSQACDCARLLRAPGQPIVGSWSLADPQVAWAHWGWGGCGDPAHWGPLGAGGRAVCCRAPCPLALGAASSGSGWEAPGHKPPVASEPPSCSSWSTSPRRRCARPVQQGRDSHHAHRAH